MTASETAAAPADAIAAIDRLPPKADDEDRVIYLVSDFRAGEWQEPVALRKSLAKLEEDGAQLHLVNCVDAMHRQPGHHGPATRGRACVPQACHY